MKSETALIYHDHKVCTECKYDSHCQLFNPGSYCLYEVKLHPDGTKPRIGNPTLTMPNSYGFTTWNRDNGQVTDGVIKGDSCHCDNKHYLDGESAAVVASQQYQVYA